MKIGVDRTKGFEYFEHTADIGFFCWGETLGDLFANAAYALMGVICKPYSTDPMEIGNDNITVHKQNLNIDPGKNIITSSAEELLHEWLELVNSNSQIENYVYFIVAVRIGKPKLIPKCNDYIGQSKSLELNLTQYNLQSFLVGKKIEVDKDELGTEVKAITWHNFYVKELETGGYEARVLLDI